MKGVAYQKFVVSAPWGVEMPQDAYSQYWRLVKGTCFLQVPGEALLEMKPGDLVFIPHGSAHWIADRPGSSRTPSAEIRKARHEGNMQPLFTGKGEETILSGGHFEWRTQVVHPFLKDLPKTIHITHLKTEEHNWLAHTLKMIFEEMSRERPGREIIVARLAEILFIQMIRAWLVEAAPTGGFLLALKDERISKALQLMQESPEKEWTLPLLATGVGMSRTLFFTVFKELTGETPLSYLTNWRIIKAKELLAVSKENISEIALQVGYQSEAAFNRVFKSRVEQTPANYRRRLGTGGE